MMRAKSVAICDAAGSIKAGEKSRRPAENRRQTSAGRPISLSVVSLLRRSVGYGCSSLTPRRYEYLDAPVAKRFLAKRVRRAQNGAQTNHLARHGIGAKPITKKKQNAARLFSASRFSS